MTEEIIRCGICHNQYINPRILPCLHTYCLDCIKRNTVIENDEFECPRQDTTRVKRNSIDSLSVNQTMQDVIDFLALSSGSIQCSNCSSTKSEHWCNECSKNYCAECSNTIHTMRPFRDHHILSIREKPSELFACEKHTDEKLKYWCQKCAQFVCSDCLLNEHKDHSYVVIQKIAKELQTKINVDLVHIQSSLDKKVSERNSLLTASGIDHELNKKQIGEAMEFLQKVIREHEREMQMKIENFQMTEKKELEEYHNRLENEVESLYIQKKTLEILLSSNDQMKLLRARQGFLIYINRVNQILAQLRVPNKREYSIEGIDIDNVPKLRNEIRQCGQVVEKKVSIINGEIHHNFQLEKFIVDHENEQRWKISMGHLTNQDIEIITKALQRYPTLTELHLTENEIDDQGIRSLASVLAQNQTLTKLSLYENQISDEGVRYLSDALDLNKVLTTLDLCRNQIGNRGIQYLADMLSRNKTLEILHLSENPIGDQGAQYLADALQQNRRLSVIYLSQNQIGDQGVHHLADALMHNTTLITLSLYHNNIGDLGAQSLARALVRNRTLATLYLAHNQIGNDGVQLLLDVFQQNRALTTFSLHQNQTDEIAQQSINQFLKRNPHMTISC